MVARKRKTTSESAESVRPGGKGEPDSTPSTSSRIGMRLKKKGKWWQCGPIKFFLLLFLGMFVLNYASLKREYTHLMPPGN